LRLHGKAKTDDANGRYHALAGLRGPKALFAGFCQEMVRSGVPVWRASLGLEGLHPEVSGWQHVWMDQSLSVHASDRATAPTSESYLNSPTRVVDETGRTFRRRLDAPCPDMPLLEDLRLAGATEYVMYPLPFLDQTRTAVISFATQQPQGFAPASLEGLELAVKLLSPYLEWHVLRRVAVDLLDTYVGRRTGQRIIEGRVDRGSVEMIEAAIWFADLRGFTLQLHFKSGQSSRRQLNAGSRSCLPIDHHTLAREGQGDGEFLQAIWLRQHTYAFGFGRALGGFGISARQKHGQIASALPDLPGQIHPVHSSRHHNVREHNVDAASIRKRAQGRRGAAYPRHLVAELNQHVGHKRSNLVVIVDEEHRAC
jgi:hypothetical protein